MTCDSQQLTERRYYLEEHSSDSPDRPSRGPEPEHLFPGEVDLTGATQQPDVLRDVIGDAIAEAEDGSLPDWGARVIARALANRKRSVGALHQFAVTGRIDKPAMARQLVEIYNTTPIDDDETREWINWLGSYVTSLPEMPGSDVDAGRSATQAKTEQTAEDVEDIDTKDNRIELGIRMHGDAFRAYLQLDSSADDPLHTFNQRYIGTYPSMEGLLRELTPLGECEEVVAFVTKALGLEGLVTIDRAGIEQEARETWDIVSYGDKLYVYTK